MKIDLQPKQTHLIGVFLILVAGAAGWIIPHVFTVRPVVLRVAILSIGITMWFSVFEALSAISSNRKFPSVRVALIFAASVLYFALTELFFKSISLTWLVPLAIAVFVAVGIVIVRRRLH